MSIDFIKLLVEVGNKLFGSLDLSEQGEIIESLLAGIYPEEYNPPDFDGDKFYSARTGLNKHLSEELPRLLDRLSQGRSLSQNDIDKAIVELFPNTPLAEDEVVEKFFNIYKKMIFPTRETQIIFETISHQYQELHKQFLWMRRGVAILILAVAFNVIDSNLDLITRLIEYFTHL
jgi:hypothetical protein